MGRPHDPNASTHPAVAVRPMADDEIVAVVHIWYLSAREAYPDLELHQQCTLADRDRIFRSHILPECDIWVAVEGDTLLGFLAIKGAYVDRLYVLPGHQRYGVGTSLLQKAQELSPDGLELDTHQQNHRARAFYEKHGFRVVRFGISPPPESTPNMTYRWGETAPAPGHSTSSLEAGQRAANRG